MGKSFRLTIPSILRENVTRKGTEIIHEDGRQRGD